MPSQNVSQFMLEVVLTEVPVQVRMDLEEHTTDDLLETKCEACGAPLTTVEIHEAREAGRPFLCSVHAAEELPAIDPESVGEPSCADVPPPPEADQA